MRTFALTAALALIVAAPLSAQEGPRVAHGAQPGRPFTPAIQVGNTFWLSGKIGVTAETRAMEEGRVAAETHNIMRSFGELLQELGMDFSNVVRADVYLTDLAGYQEMNEAYSQYFPDAAPARVTVGGVDLVAGATVEIAFIAVRN